MSEREVLESSYDLIRPGALPGSDDPNDRIRLDDVGK